MLVHEWNKWKMGACTRYRLEIARGQYVETTPYFIDRPRNRAHADAMGIPPDFRYALYKSGAHPSGCALQVSVTHTLNKAKEKAVDLWREDEGMPPRAEQAQLF